MPPEYCPFSQQFDQCQVWLKNNHPQFYNNLYPDETLLMAEDKKKKSKSSSS
jgi:hypothetical protein